MGLSDQLRNVSPSSLPAEPEPDVKADEAPVKDEEGDGRTIDNVRGELLRKQEKDKVEIMGAIAQLSQAVSARPEPAPAPSNQSVDKSLDNMSVAELNTFERSYDWSTATDVEKSNFAAFKQSKQLEETVDSKLGSFTKAQELKNLRDRYNQEAVDLYPDLKNPGSEIARSVEAKLAEMSNYSPSLVADNPRAVFDAANEIALKNGIRPEARREVHGLTKPASARTAPADRQAEEDPPGMMTDEQRATMAKAFKAKGALPPGKDFDLDEIKKDERQVRENLGQYLGNQRRGS